MRAVLTPNRRPLLVTVTVVVGGLLLVHQTSRASYDGPPIANHDGERFVNQEPIVVHGFAELVKWGINRNPGPWQEVVPGTRAAPPPESVGAGELRVTFINHASLLVQLDGINILTDPVYSDRVGPTEWIGSKRFRPPGIALEDLPKIHAVVISHNHYDHLDLPTLQQLYDRDQPTFVVGLGNRSLLESEGLPTTLELNWWQTTRLSPAVTITAVPAMHWSRRGPFDHGETLWAGYVIAGAGGPVYFAGDTGWGRHFEEISLRFGPMRLALLPIGAFRPRWFMKTMHISPEEAVDAARVLFAGTSVAMHFGTFRLGDDGQTEPVEVLQTYLAQIPSPPRFWVLDFGEGRDVPALQAPGTN